MQIAEHSEGPILDAEIDTVSERIAWSALAQLDADNLRTLNPLAEEVTDRIVDEFFEHAQTFERVDHLFRDPEAIRQLKAAKKKHYREIVLRTIDDDFLASRARLGEVNERFGVGPDFAIRAYDFYLNAMGELILKRNVDNPARAFDLYASLQKMVHLDMSAVLESFVRARELAVEEHQRQLSDLPTPVLQLRNELLLVPVVGALDSHRARSLTIQLLEGIKRARAKVLVLDITGVSAVDSAVASHLVQTINAAQLMGTYSIVTGISSAIAQALVKIGFSGESLNTMGDLQHGIEKAERILRKDAPMELR